MKYKGYLDHVELHIISSYSRFNTRLASSPTCHMLPLDQSNIEAIVVPYIHQNLLIFMNEPIVMQACLYVLNMSLAKYECYVKQLYLALLEERHVIYKCGGALISSWRSQVCSIHLSTCKIFSHQVADRKSVV